MQLNDLVLPGCNSFTRHGIAVVGWEKHKYKDFGYITIAGKRSAFVYRCGKGGKGGDGVDIPVLHKILTPIRKSIIGVSSPASFDPKRPTEPVVCMFTSDADFFIHSLASGSLLYKMKVNLSYLALPHVQKIPTYKKGVSCMSLAEFSETEDNGVYILILFGLPNGCLYMVELSSKGEKTDKCASSSRFGGEEDKPVKKKTKIMSVRVNLLRCFSGKITAICSSAAPAHAPLVVPVTLPNGEQTKMQMLGQKTHVNKMLVSVTMSDGKQSMGVITYIKGTGQAPSFTKFNSYYCPHLMERSKDRIKEMVNSLRSLLGKKTDGAKAGKSSDNPKEVKRVIADINRQVSAVCLDVEDMEMGNIIDVYGRKVRGSSSDVVFNVNRDVSNNTSASAALMPEIPTKGELFPCVQPLFYDATAVGSVFFGAPPSVSSLGRESGTSLLGFIASAASENGLWECKGAYADAEQSVFPLLYTQEDLYSLTLKGVQIGEEAARRNFKEKDIKKYRKGKPAKYEISSMTVIEKRDPELTCYVLAEYSQRNDTSSIVCYSMKQLHKVSEEKPPSLWRVTGIRGKILAMTPFKMAEQQSKDPQDLANTPHIVYTTYGGEYGVAHPVLSNIILHKDNGDTQKWLQYFESFRLFDTFTNHQMMSAQLTDQGPTSFFSLFRGVCVASWHPDPNFTMSKCADLLGYENASKMPLLVVGTTDGWLRVIGGATGELGVLCEQKVDDGPILDLKFMHSPPFMLAVSCLGNKIHILQLVPGTGVPTAGGFTPRGNDVIRSDKSLPTVPPLELAAVTHPVSVSLPITALNWSQSGTAFSSSRPRGMEEQYVLIGGSNGTGAIFSVRQRMGHHQGQQQESSSPRTSGSVSTSSALCSFSGHCRPISAIRFVDNTTLDAEVQNIADAHKSLSTPRANIPPFHTVVSASRDGSIRLWTMISGVPHAVPVSDLAFHTSSITALCVHPLVPSFLLSADECGNIAAWDVSIGFNLVQRICLSSFPSDDDSATANENKVSAVPRASLERLRLIIGADKLDNIAEHGTDSTLPIRRPLFVVHVHSVPVVNLHFDKHHPFTLVTSSDEGTLRSWQMAPFVFPLSRIASLSLISASTGFTLPTSQRGRQDILDSVGSCTWDLSKVLRRVTSGPTITATTMTTMSSGGSTKTSLSVADTCPGVFKPSLPSAPFSNYAANVDSQGPMLAGWYSLVNGQKVSVKGESDALNVLNVLRPLYGDLPPEIDVLAQLLSVLVAPDRDVASLLSAFPSVPQWLALLSAGKLDEGLDLLLALAGVVLPMGGASDGTDARAALRQAAVQRRRGMYGALDTVPSIPGLPRNSVTVLKAAGLADQWLAVIMLALLVDKLAGNSHRVRPAIKYLEQLASRGIHVGTLATQTGLANHARLVAKQLGAKTLDGVLRALLDKALASAWDTLGSVSVIPRLASVCLCAPTFAQLSSTPCAPLLPHLLAFAGNLPAAVAAAQTIRAANLKGRLLISSLTLPTGSTRPLDGSQLAMALSYLSAQQCAFALDGFDTLGATFKILQARGVAGVAQELYTCGEHGVLFGEFSRALTIAITSATEDGGISTLFANVVRKLSGLPQPTSGEENVEGHKDLSQYIALHSLGKMVEERDNATGGPSESNNTPKYINPPPPPATNTSAIVTALGTAPSLGVALLTKVMDGRLAAAIGHFPKGKMSNIVGVARDVTSAICNLLPGIRLDYHEGGLVSGLLIHLSAVSWVAGGIMALHKSSILVEYTESDGEPSVGELLDGDNGDNSGGGDGDGNNTGEHPKKPEPQPTVVLEAPSLLHMSVIMLRNAYRLLARNLRAIKRGDVNDELEKSRITQAVSTIGRRVETEVTKTVKLAYFSPFPTDIPIDSVARLLSYAFQLLCIARGGTAVGIFREGEQRKVDKVREKVSSLVEKATSRASKHSNVRSLVTSSSLDNLNVGNSLGIHVDRFTELTASHELFVTSSTGSRLRLSLNPQAAFEWSLFSPFAPVGAFTECGESSAGTPVGVPRNCLAPFAPGVVIPWCV